MVKIKKISFISLIIMSVYCSSSIAFDLDDLKGLADDVKKNIEETGDALQKDIEDSSKNNQKNPEEKSNQPKVAEPKLAEPKVAEPKKVIPKKQDVSKKGKDIASKSKTKFKLFKIEKEDKMTGTKTIDVYALNSSSDGVGKIETKISCDNRYLSTIDVQFTLFDTAIKNTKDGFASGRNRLNKKVVSDKYGLSLILQRSPKFNNVWNALSGSIFIENSQLFACMNKDILVTCDNKNNPVPLYDLAYSFPTSSGEDYFIDIPPYNPVIQDLIKSCSN